MSFVVIFRIHLSPRRHGRGRGLARLLAHVPLLIIHTLKQLKPRSCRAGRLTKNIIGGGFNSTIHGSRGHGAAPRMTRMIRI